MLNYIYSLAEKTIARKYSGDECVFYFARQETEITLRLC